MGRRIEVSRDAPQVTIASRVLGELYAHAKDSAPDECCGLVIGNARERFRRVARCRNDMTLMHEQDPETYPRDNHSAYFMNPHDYDQVMREADERGERVTAVYHSHVGAGVYLSELDLAYANGELFPFPDAAQIVIGVFGPTELTEFRPLEAGVFERDGNTGQWCPGRILCAEEPARS